MIDKLRSRKGAVAAIGLAACLGTLLLGVFGGTASGLEPKLSWYACVKAAGGPHEYEDSKCSKASASGQYWWARVTNRSFTSSSTEQYIIKYAFSGIESEIKCAGANGSGTLTGNETGAGIETYSLHLTGCWPTVPVGSGCKIKGEEITLPLKGKSPVWPETLKSELAMELSSEGSFLMEGCKLGTLNGTYTVGGGFPVQVINAESRMSTTMGESSGKLTIRGAKASIEGSSEILATGFWWGPSPVKLATAP